MAIHKSDIIQAKDSLNISEKSAFNSDRTNATVLQATAVYTFKGTEGANDIVELADLPAGATVIPHQSYVADSFPSGLAGGSTVDVHLGVAGDPTRFGYVDYLNSGNARNFTNSVLHTPVPFAEQTRVVAKLSALNGPVIPSGKKLAFGITYTIKG